MRTFEEIQADLARQAEAENTPRSFEQLQADLAAQAEAERGPTPADEAWEVAKSGMRGVSSGAGFLTKLANVPRDINERIEAGAEAAAEARRSNVPTIFRGFDTLPAFLGGFATAETPVTRDIDRLYRREMYDPDLAPEDMSMPGRVLSRSAEIAGELATTGLVGGPSSAAVPSLRTATGLDRMRRGAQTSRGPLRQAAQIAPPDSAVREAARTTAGASVLGGLGQEVGGTPGELVGILAGVIAGDRDAAVGLSKFTSDVGRKVASIPKEILGVIRANKFKHLGEITLDTATDSQLRLAVRQILTNATPEDVGVLAQLDEMLPQIEAAIKSGRVGTLGQLTGNRGIRAFERDLAASPEFRATPLLDRLDSSIRQRAVDAVKDVAPQGVVSRVPQSAEQAIAPRRTSALNRMQAAQRRQAAAEQAERAAREPFSARLSPAADAESLADATRSVQTARYNAIKEEWAEITGGTPIAKTDVLDEIREFESGLTTLEKAKVREDFSGTFRLIDRLDDDVPLEDLNLTLSQLSSEARALSTGTKTGASASKVKELQDALYSAMARSSKEGVSEARRKAAANYRAYMTEFGKASDLGKALDDNPEAFSAFVLQAGPKGAGRLRAGLEAAGNDTEVLVAAQNALRSKFRNDAFKDGAINPSTAVNFEKKYRDHLNLPGMEPLKAEVDQALTRAQALRQTTAETTAAVREGEKAVEALQKSPTGVFAATGQTTDEVIAAAKNIASAKGGRDRIANMRTLMSDLADNPQAIEDVRRAFAQDLVNSVTKDGVLSTDAYRTFRQRKEFYEKSGVFTADELNNIDDMMAEAQKMYALDSGKKLARLPAERRRVAEALTGLVGAKVGAQAFGSPLIGAAYGRKFATDWLQSVTTDVADRLAFDLMTNPDQFAGIIQRLQQPGLTPVEIDGLLRQLFNAAEAAYRTNELGD